MHPKTEITHSIMVIATSNSNRDGIIELFANISKILDDKLEFKI